LTHYAKQREENDADCEHERECGAKRKHRQAEQAKQCGLARARGPGFRRCWRSRPEVRSSASKALLVHGVPLSEWGHDPVRVLHDGCGKPARRYI